MFDSLSDRLAEVFRRFTGQGKLSREDVEAGLREVRLALLEADVNFKVARRFVDRIRERAVGSEVLESLTPGRLQIDQRMIDEVKEIRKRVAVHESLLVVDAMTGQEAVNVAKAFHDQVGVDGVILTKLDGDARGGAALSMRETIGAPILYSGIGEKPADLEPFHPERMASRILGMGDVLTLIEKAQEHVDEKKAKELEERVLAGRLTMDDWLEQMRQMRSMGSIESILGMLPGGRKMVQQMGAAMPSERDLSRMEAIVLSMTAQERRRPEIVKGSRRRRIAAGSGTQMADVNRLLKGFEQASALMRQLGGGKGTKGMRGKVRAMRNLRGLDP